MKQSQVMVRLLGVFTAATFSFSAIADTLPKTAVPFSSEELVQLYKGKTVFMKGSDDYFAPDGSVTGKYGSPKIKPLPGKWSVNGNEICVDYGSSKDCWKYWKDAKKAFSQWSVHFDGSHLAGLAPSVLGLGSFGWKRLRAQAA